MEMNKMKPECNLIGADGNIFNLMSIARKTLLKENLVNEAKEMVERIPKEAEDYNHALRIIMEYVEEVEMALGIEIKNGRFAIYSIPLLEHDDIEPIGGRIGNKNWLAEHLEVLARKIRTNPGNIQNISLLTHSYGYPSELVIEMTGLAELDKI
jgi:hypothetical protein